MKKLSILAMVCFLLASCATTTITTSIGLDIAESFKKNAERGAIGAQMAIKAWPFVSGMIRDLMAGNYKLEMNQNAQDIMDHLDKLAAKKDLTLKEKGGVIGSIVRLEIEGVKIGWDKYGVNLTNLFSKAIGG